MQAPLAPSPAQQDETARLARLALQFVVATSPRSCEFAQRKLAQLFGYNIAEEDLRRAQMEVLADSSAALSAILLKGRRP
jgi:hypothetical protein